MSGPGPADPPPGPWRYQIRVPPLPPTAYQRASRLLVRTLPGVRSWRRLVVALAFGPLFGGLAGYATSSAGIGFDALLTGTRPEFEWYLDGSEAFLLLVALLVLVIVAIGFLNAIRRARLTHAIHTATRALNAPNDLLLAEDALEWRGPTTTLRAPWSAVSASVRDRDTLLLRLDGLGFVWLPDASLGDAARRAEILAFVADRLARAAPGARG